MTDGTMIENRTFDEIEVGDTASISRTLTEEDIQLFALVSGDVNPAHMDADYAATDMFRNQQKLRRAVERLAKNMPEELRTNEDWALLEKYGDEKVYNIIQLIYHARSYEGVAKDFEFSRYTMHEHWQSGYDDAVRTLRHPEVIERPTSEDGVLTFDVSQHDHDHEHD